MTLQKAVKIIDWWIEQKKKSYQMLQESEPIPTDVTRTLMSLDEMIISNLEKIKEEIIPDCTHPQEMQDTCNGQTYCMNCNWDLGTKKVTVEQ